MVGDRPIAWRVEKAQGTWKVLSATSSLLQPGRSELMFLHQGRCFAMARKLNCLIVMKQLRTLFPGG